MKRTWKIAVLCVLGMACGGSDGAPPPPNFNYGELSTVTNPYSSEGTAASSAQTSLSDALALQADPSTGASSGSSIIGMPDTLAGNLALYGISGQVVASPSLAENTAISAQVTQALTMSGTCSYTVSGTTITYTDCAATIDGMNVTLTGSVTGSTNGLTWNVTATASGTFSTNSGPVAINMTWHATGDIKVTSTTIQGWARSDVAASGSANGQTVSLAFSTQADVNLTFQPATQATPFCIVSGTLELRRWWTQVPNGASGNPYFANKGVKLVWSGDGSSCFSTLQVAYSQ